MTFETHSVLETQALGAALAQQLQPDDVLLMLGDMGAGKSEFTRGLARGLGVTGYVTSPTFTIMQLHESGRLPLYHFDWYVAVIEWPSRAEEAIPETYLEVAIEPLGDDVRRITFTPVGGFHDLDQKGLTL